MEIAAKRHEHEGQIRYLGCYHIDWVVHSLHQNLLGSQSGVGIRGFVGAITAERLLESVLVYSRTVI